MSTSKSTPLNGLKYLAGYSAKLTGNVEQLLAEKRLGGFLLGKYPAMHDIRTDRALYDYALEIKNEFLRNAQPLSRVTYDSKINVLNNALGLHTFISRVQGGKLKAKNEIRSPRFSGRRRSLCCG